MISTLNKISRDHNCCEDSFFVREDEYAIWGGVFDGCSTGINSHFASSLFSYIFADWIRPTFFSLFDSRIDHSMITGYIPVILSIKSIKQQIGLQYEHLLSTILIFYYEKDSHTLRVRAFGDGVYYVNSVEYYIEQNNLVDYFTTHLVDDYKSFLKYLEKNPTKIYKDVTDFKVCTDGIKAIRRPQFAPPTTRNALSLLLHPPTGANYLERQWNILKNDHFYLNDDLTIISYAHV